MRQTNASPASTFTGLWHQSGMSGIGCFRRALHMWPLTGSIVAIETQYQTQLGPKMLPCQPASVGPASLSGAADAIARVREIPPCSTELNRGTLSWHTQIVVP